MRAFLTLLCVSALPGCIVPVYDKSGFVDETDDDDSDPPVYRPDSDAPWDTAYGDDDSESPDADEEDTGDLFDTASTLWRPKTVSYWAEFGVGSTGGIEGFTFFGVRSPAYFEVELARGLRSCIVTYELVSAAWASSPTSGSHAGLKAFLAANGHHFGFVVDPTITPVSTTADCNYIDPSFGVDIANDALTLGGGGPGTLYVGFDTSPTADVVQFFQGTTITTDRVLGGRIEFPFTFGTPAQDHFPIGGLWAALDQYGEPQVTLGASGYVLVLQPATSAWNGTKPSEGFYRMISIYQFNLN